MQLKINDLSSHLKSDLVPVYLFYGGEPLLVEESADKLRRTARLRGFDERIVFTLETGFDWSGLSSEFDSFSLFSNKKFIELRLPTGKPGVKGAEVLTAIAARRCPDTILLILCEKLESTTKKSKWIKQITQFGIVVEHNTIPTNQLANWVKQRARDYQLAINDDARQLLVYYLEGNLLAIDQQLKRFRLLKPDQPIMLNDIQKGVEDSARFTIYSFVDEAIGGNLKRALRMLKKLKLEGVEPVLINWAIARETRSLLEMSTQMNHGQPLKDVLRHYRVWSNRARIVESALKRIRLSNWQKIHHALAVTDRVIKGRESALMKADIWTEYERITYQLCKAN